jgi:hypothetical protein
MEQIVAQIGGLPDAQAVLVVEIARNQNELYGGTEDFLVTREFAAHASPEQRHAVVEACFAIAAADGTISSVSEEGDDISIPTGTGTADPVNLRITLTAGPTCPVVRNPPDPACAPRPLANVQVDVYDIDGMLVASGSSGADGLASAQLPAGAYFAVAADVDGLMGRAEPLAFAALGGDTVSLAFTYDTGIR